MCTNVNGDYIVEVRTLNYSNPGTLLADGRCCVMAGDGSCDVSGCVYYFIYCLRSLGRTGPGCSRSFATSGGQGNAPIDFSQDRVLGQPNPLPLPGLTTEWNVSVKSSVYWWV